MSVEGFSVDEEWITSSDGHPIFTKTWTPTGEVTATLVLVHGFGEHISRYNHVVAAFATIGVLTHGFDQRGFGETGKKSKSLGVTGGFKKVLADVDEALVRTKQEGKPQFLFGHSMGGMVVLNYAAVGAHRLELVDGIISSAPLVTPSVGPPAPVIAILKGVAEVVPSFQIKIDVSADFLSRDPEEVKKYIADPLVHNLSGLKSAKDMIVHGKALMTKKLGASITQPILQAHGTADKINFYHDSKTAFDLYASTDKTWRGHEEYYHELHNEPLQDREGVIREYVEWLQKQIAKYKKD
ncbi:Alpha/Beta hydrolase protein [Endogone sp. FLAS-F59071]|nr:Alpha/Beta hydrolase protein [Endogone sp. FLAS-F59071]|eukprot:RUS22843.1 Alpha/Beta hydrolase protein [Endogone sp. FLAS-F59071]